MAKMVLEFEKPILELEQKIEEMRKYADNLDIADEISTLEKKVDQLRESIFSNLTRWQRVQLARHPDRPYTLDYIHLDDGRFRRVARRQVVCRRQGHRWRVRATWGTRPC